MNPNESILCIVYCSNDFISVSIQFNQIQSEATFKSKQYEMSTILENTNSVCVCIRWCQMKLNNVCSYSFDILKLNK